MSGVLDRVAGVVVTHRRPRLATQVVRSLIEVERLGPDQIYLVVNGEGGLDDPELQRRINVIALPENPGPAGGFREGMLAALKAGASWFYLCEDDIGLFDVPAPRLAALIEAIEAQDDAGANPVGAVVAYGRDLHSRTGHTSVHDVDSAEGFDEVDVASWGASLVSSKVIDAGAIPSDDYFFGYEDFDFWYQIKALGFRILVDRSSAFASARQMSLAGRDAAFEGQRPLDYDEPWRAFYIARNYFMLARRHGDRRWVAAHLLYSARRLQLASSSAERRAILSGLVAGITRRTGKDERFLRERGEESPDPGHTRLAPTRYDVVHVLPQDVARGAQVFAQELRDRLDSDDVHHHLVTLFRAPDAVLRPDSRIDAPGGRLRAALDPRALRGLRRELKTIRPSVVVAHGSEPLKYLAALPKRWWLVYLAIGTVSPSALRGPRKRIHRSLLSRADRVVGVSLDTTEELEQNFGVRAPKLLMIPNGRDAAKFTTTAYDRNDDSSGPVTLVFLGHLNPLKRPDVFVRVVAALHARGEPVAAVVIGDGEMAAGLERSAAGLPVRFLGRRDDVPEQLTRADVFVFTSVSAGEGMPGVLIEAGLAGLPSVATDVPGVSTVVENGLTGLVVGEDDFDALVDATSRLVSDGVARRSMGSSARQRCLADFSLDSVAEQWRDLLEELAGEHHRQ